MARSIVKFRTNKLHGAPDYLGTQLHVYMYKAIQALKMIINYHNDQDIKFLKVHVHVYVILSSFLFCHWT